MSQNVENSYEDHPRGCGEHSLLTWAMVWRTGSSPRMRGAPICSNKRNGKTRIIPADAGSTTCSTGRACRNGDHPRGCGEHRMRHTMKGKRKGSSPRMRGALISSGISRNTPRIIPADAGSTDTILQRKATRRDHPRGCGEHHHALLDFPQLGGSSPRMRGAHEQ